MLFQVVGGAVAARGDEIALAKLRGLSPWRTVLFALGEPVGLLALAAPIGFGVALAVAHALGASALVGGTPVARHAAAWWALAAAFTGSALSRPCSRRGARSPARCSSSGARRRLPSRGTRFLLVLDLALAAAAVVAVAGLRLDTRRGRCCSSRPPCWCSLSRSSARGCCRRRCGWACAHPRRAADRAVPGAATDGAAPRRAATGDTAGGRGRARHVRRLWRGGRARQPRPPGPRPRSGRRAGWRCSSRRGHDPQSVIVDAVDPHGRWSMAAATWSADGGTADARTINGLLLGVEPARLPHVSYDVRGQLSPGGAGARRSCPPPPVRRPSAGGTCGSSSTRRRWPATTPPSVLQIRHAHAAATTVQAGTLTAGVHAYTAAVDCTDGCSFAGLIIDRSIDAQDLVQADLRVLAVQSDGPAAPTGRCRCRWPPRRPGGPASSGTARTPRSRESG